jgi:UMF1 family MFS transporter
MTSGADTAAKFESAFRKDVIGWSLYDFANTIYSMNIVTLYLKRYIVEDLGYGHQYYDIPFSISMFFAAILLPALGAMSDHATKKKLFLFLFTTSCCVAVGLMSLVAASSIMFLLLLFIVANFSYEAGQPFYNSLLYSVADGRQARWVSGIGVALGYVGSILGMIFVAPFVTGEVFGFDVPFLEESPKSASFIPTAVLFMLFALPLFLWVREKPAIKAEKAGFRKAYREVWEGLRETKKYPGVLRFLISDYFFEDAAMTVIINIGIYCSVVLAFNEAQILTFLVISTATAVLGSFLIGWLARIWALKRLVALIVVGWIVALVAFVFIDHPAVIWVLGSVVGILLGGLWTTTRPLLAELVPREELGRFFGIFSLSGRAAAMIGPLVWTGVFFLFQSEQALGATVTDILSLDDRGQETLPYKAGILSLAVMMVIGLFLFRKVPHGQRSGDE